MAARMIALVVGPDAATVRDEVTKLLQKQDPSSENTVRFDGKSTAFDHITVAVGTPGFFGTGRVVVVDDLMAKYAKGGKSAGSPDDADTAASDSGGADFLQLFATVQPSNSLILVDPSLSVVPAAVKRAAPAEALHLVCEPPRGQELLQWIQQRASAESTRIDNRAARVLAERTFPQTWSAKPMNPAYDRPPDLDRLRGEIAKLALAAYPDPIGEEHVRSMVASAAEDRLFPFIEALVTSRIGEAIPAWESLQATGDDPGRVIAQVYQQVELAAILSAAGTAMDPATVGKDLGLSNPKRMIGVAKTAARARVSPRDILARLLETERLTKRGALKHGDDVVYHMLAVCAGNDKRGGR